jgi:hypothetical protein
MRALVQGTLAVAAFVCVFAACSTGDSREGYVRLAPDADADASALADASRPCTTPPPQDGCKDPCGRLEPLCSSGDWTCATTGRDTCGRLDPSSPPPPPLGGPCSVKDGTGTLPGVSIAIEADGCTMHEADGGDFRYRITVSDPAPTLTIPNAGTPCGACQPYTSNPFTFASAFVYGSMQASSGSVQPGGCCAPQSGSITLKPGVASGTFRWTGRTWDGPAFPPGDYAVEVTIGDQTRSFTATLPIHVIPK